MRVPPLPADQWDEAVDRALAVMLPQERRNPENASNILGTFVNHPDLTKEFLKFNVHLLFNSTLPPRLRELAILRVAHRTDSKYEWVQHVKMACAKASPTTTSRAFSVARPPTRSTAPCWRPSTNFSRHTNCPMPPGRRLANASTNDSGWTSSSRSGATSPCPWL